MLVGGIGRGATALGSIGAGIIPGAESIALGGLILQRLGGGGDELVLNPLQGWPHAPGAILWGVRPESVEEDRAALVAGFPEASGQDLTSPLSTLRDEGKFPDLWRQYGKRLVHFADRFESGHDWVQGGQFMLRFPGGVLDPFGDSWSAETWQKGLRSKTWYEREFITEKSLDNAIRLVRRGLEVQDSDADPVFWYLPDHKMEREQWLRIAWHRRSTIQHQQLRSAGWRDFKREGKNRRKFREWRDRWTHKYEVERDVWLAWREEQRAAAAQAAAEAQALEAFRAQYAAALANGLPAPFSAQPVTTHDPTGTPLTSFVPTTFDSPSPADASTSGEGGVSWGVALAGAAGLLLLAAVTR